MSKDPGEEAESCTPFSLLATCSCVQNGFQVCFLFNFDGAGGRSQALIHAKQVFYHQLHLYP